MKSKIYIFGILLILIYFCIYSCRKAGAWLVKSDEPIYADAMIVLLGTIPDRVLEAADLYQKKMVDKVLIVEGINLAYRELEARGVKMISSVEQIRFALTDLGIPGDSIIILKGYSQSTHQEALIVSKFLLNNPGIDTLMLISSSPHMRRAYMIFKNVFSETQKNVCVLCMPSSYTEFNAGKWWKSKDDIETVLLEYLKLFNFVLIERFSWLKEVS